MKRNKGAISDKEMSRLYNATVGKMTTGVKGAISDKEMNRLKRKRKSVKGSPHR
jgi:hypothetical protein